MKNIKTLDIQAKTWFDKVNGNSYFACLITVDFGKETETSLKIPFTYGYGNQFEYEAIRLLKKEGFLPENLGGYLREYCEENGIILSINRQKNCLKRELKNLTA